ncbi:type I methionyl aminopeptidase [Cellulomonas humilata]|uniref:Methionine aminopeptidase n=1 Tax=Cellulomonas humilata TaxID=144055 RepID=A0ABU0EJ93_9CELL|nr:type I methionyl aminopeptidase [Cellulomonas humilata]MDQ0375360.1 methionyl aminopeptidase [Cellulomonas humilata]
MFGRERIEYKSPDQVLLMRRAGLVVAEALAAVRERAAPGVTTGQLDAVAAEVIADHHATASFLGYHGYPATLCVSVNDEVVHGIPGARVLEPGDVVSIDCGAIVDGWHGDSAITVVLDGAAPEDVDLAATTERAMWSGIAALTGAERLGVVGEAVEDVVDAAEAAGLNGGARYGLVEEYVGHGIGTSMHQPPDVPNFRSRDRGPRVRPGLCVAVEPMVVRGQRFTQVLDDDWTVVTSDGSRASHWEHTVAVLDDGIWVLTAVDGGAQELGARGVAIAPLA